ncbi:MAG: HAMP domain-containing protein, partial [Spirochaetales bacterium]
MRTLEVSMSKRSSVARRVFVTLTLLFFTIVGLVALSMYFTVTGSVEAAVLGNVTRDMALAARDFEIWLSGKTGTLETLRYTALRFSEQPEIIHKLLIDASAADTDISWIYFGSASFDPKKRTVVADGLVRSGAGYYLDGSGWTPAPGWDWTKRPWFLQSAVYPDAVVGSPYSDEDTGDTVVSITLACKKADGTLLGVLGADVLLSRLTTIVSMRRFTQNSRTYLVDREGTLITKEERISETPLVPSHNVFSPGSPLVGLRSFMNSVERTSGLLRKEGLYYASSRVPRTNWLIISLGPVADVASPVFAFYRTLAIISFLGLLAAILFAILESRSISKPIEALKRGALALAAGNLEYRVSIESNDEFGELADFFNHVAINLKSDMDRMEEQRAQIQRYSQTLKRKVYERTRKLNEANALLRLRNDQMEEEVQMAAAVQRKIVPSEAELPRSPALSFGARYLAMANVGGDLYDAMDLGGGRYAFIIGDVSGHGIPAALIAAMAKVSFRSHALRGWETDAILFEVNRELCELIGGETYFVSAFMAILDVTDGSVMYANAGHPPALLRHADGNVEELAASEGQLLGITEDFPLSQGSTSMCPGDRLVLYTDGIIEARSVSGEFYDLPRLMTFLTDHGSGAPSTFVGLLLEDVAAFSSGVHQSDDRAVLIIGFERYVTDCPGRDLDAVDQIRSAELMTGAGSVREAAATLEDLRR